MFKTKTSVSIAALSAPLAATVGVVWADNSQPSSAWELLADIEIEEIVTETSYEVRKIYPAEIENGVEKFDISGYVVPLYSETDIKEFILISDMGFCPFCGDPDHGTSLQVNLTEAMPNYIEGQRITVRGALEPVTDTETWQTTVLTGAKVL